MFHLTEFSLCCHSVFSVKCHSDLEWINAEVIRPIDEWNAFQMAPPCGRHCRSRPSALAIRLHRTAEQMELNEQVRTTCSTRRIGRTVLYSLVIPLEVCYLGSL